MESCTDNKGESKQIVFFIVFLRILAMCFITNTHYNNIYPTEAMAVGGLVGDVLFFAISGYCLCVTNKKFLGWYGKRIVRIYLPVVVITLVYLCVGWYTIESNGILGLLLFPTKYHFVASIMILYIPFYFVCKSAKLRKRIPLVMMVIGVVWLTVYLFLYDKTYYHVDYVKEPFIWFLFFESMLLGAYVREKSFAFCNSSKKFNLLFTVSFAIIYFASKYCISRYENLVNFQFITQISIFIFLYGIIRLFASLNSFFERSLKKIKGASFFLSQLTLEIYLVQQPIIGVLENIVFFPFNWLIVTVSIFLAAILLHFACELILLFFHTLLKIKTNKKDEFGFRDYLIIRRIFEGLITLVALIILSPLLLIISLLIKIDSKGPVIFKQERIGKNGRVFKMYKFRTMVVGAQNMAAGVYSFDGDPRITRIGKFLRKTSLDELPQLFNVFIGNMSIVGPRAPVYGHFPEYKTLNYVYKKRFDVRPGITGLAQVVGRNELSWDEKVKYDNIYIDKVKRFTLFYDIKIVFMTFLRVFSMSNINETQESLDLNKKQLENATLNDEVNGEVKEGEENGND